MFGVESSNIKPVFATEYARDEGARRWIDQYTGPYFHESEARWNNNQDRLAIQFARTWFPRWNKRPGTGEEVVAGGLNIVFSDSQSHARGEDTFRCSGAVDPMRIKKEGFHAHRVMWNGWLNPDNRDAYILGHWTYADGVTKDVIVMSNCDEVELFVNGKFLGLGSQGSRFVFTFPDVAFEPGTLRAVGYDNKGQARAEYSVETVGAAESIRLSLITSPDGLQADGRDVALIDVEVVDAQGRVVPSAANEVTYEISGVAEWLGGCAGGKEGNYVFEKTLPVEVGLSRVMVRASTQPGAISIRAKAKGLQSGELNFESKVVPAVTDLSSYVYPVELVTRKIRIEALNGEVVPLPTIADDSIYPAEAAELKKGAKSQTGNGSLGDGYVDLPKPGDGLEWSEVSVPSSGKYVLHFRYANGESPHSESAYEDCHVYVNGQFAGHLSFYSSGGREVWADETLSGVPLRAGKNLVQLVVSEDRKIKTVPTFRPFMDEKVRERIMKRFEKETEKGGPSIDQMSVRPVPSWL